MAPLSQLLSSVLLVAGAQAHFTLNYPNSIGFDDDTEGTAPCGGYAPDFAKDNVTDFHVGGDAVSLTSGHPQMNWLFRATLDQTANSNWTQIFPITQQVGLNSYCEPSITVPSSYVGQKGIIGVVANAPDGYLYQCALVNFVEGVGGSQSVCTNSSGVQISFVDDETLAAMVGTDATTTTNNTSTTTTTSSTTSSTGESSGSSFAPALGGLVSALLMGAAFLV